MAARQQLNIDLDADVASILRSHAAAAADVSEGEIVALALVREELHAAPSERNAAA